MKALSNWSTHSEERARYIMDKPPINKDAAAAESESTNFFKTSQPTDHKHARGGPVDPDATNVVDAAQVAQELGRLGDYELKKVIGTGGMGVVYLAEDTRLKRPVALKAMLPEIAANAYARKRFLREARLAASIKHDHIVTIYQVGDADGLPYLAMEFLQGEPLNARLKRERKLPLDEVVRIGTEMAEGLAAAHAEGLVHRDIKPANIWLEGKKGRVKILDFGLARAAHSDAQLTDAGTILGTPSYMSPEQAQGMPVDSRSDLFSAGVVLYQLCTGKLPFHGSDTISTLLAVTTHVPPAPAALDAEVPAALSELVMKLLAKEAAQRVASAQEVSNMLQGMHMSATTIHVSRHRLPTVSASRRRPLLARALFGLLALAGFGALALGVIRIATEQGEYVLQTDDPDIAFKVHKGVVTLVDEHAKRSYRLKVVSAEKEKFLLEVTEAGSGVTFNTGLFSVRQGETIRVKAWFEGKQAVPPAQLAVAPFTEKQAKALQESWAKRLDVAAVAKNILGMDMALIPPGEFPMTDKSTVRISRPFRLGSCEVTVGQFRAFVKETGHKTTAEKSGKGGHAKAGDDWIRLPEYIWTHPSVAPADDFPVAYVSWQDAVAFCDWLSSKAASRYRLPSEAEWEWACRAGSLGKYHFGSDPAVLGEYAWYEANAAHKSHPVAQKKPNCWHLYDMHGNLAEFCQDWNAQLPADRLLIDPRGPAQGDIRVVRSYAFMDAANVLEANSRAAMDPSSALFHIGFRVACDVVND